MTINDIAEVIVRILAIGAAVEAAEILARPRDYENGGIYSWTLIRTKYRWSTVGLIAKALDVIFVPRAYRFLMLVQIIVAAALFSGVIPATNGVLVLSLFILRSLIHIRHQYGLDGSDQMNAIILASMTLFYLAPTQLSKGVVIGFVAFQSILAYFSSGMAKAISPVWRSGKALSGILNTQSYGSKIAANALRRNPQLSLIACWAVILYQITFPIFALISPTSCAIVLTLGVLFHVSVAVSMGLNNFVWSFTAAYPAVWMASKYVAALNV